MWVYRLGLTKVKWLALTGEALSGKEAAEIDLINKAVPFEQPFRRPNPDHVIRPGSAGTKGT